MLETGLARSEGPVPTPPEVGPQAARAPLDCRCSAPAHRAGTAARCSAELRWLRHRQSEAPQGLGPAPGKETGRRGIAEVGGPNGVVGKPGQTSVRIGARVQGHRHLTLIVQPPRVSGRVKQFKHVGGRQIHPAERRLDRAVAEGLNDQAISPKGEADGYPGRPGHRPCGRCSTRAAVR